MALQVCMEEAWYKVGINCLKISQKEINMTVTAVFKHVNQLSFGQHFTSLVIQLWTCWSTMHSNNKSPELPNRVRHLYLMCLVNSIKVFKHIKMSIRTQSHMMLTETLCGCWLLKTLSLKNERLNYHHFNNYQLFNVIKVNDHIDSFNIYM